VLTVDEIRKLRDEATQPPWTIDEVWQDVVAADGQLIVAQCEILADAKLIAAAPDLADTAIAQDKRIAELCTEAETLSNRVEAKRLMHEDCERQCAELEAENARLRDAMQDLIDSLGVNPPTYGECALDNCIAALKGEQE